MTIESGFFSDAALSAAITSLYSGQLEDGSSSAGVPSPSDRKIYFGLPNASKQVQASSNPGVDSIEIRIVSNVSAWQASTTYATGDIMQPTTPNGYKYEIQNDGDWGGTEPTWPTTIGADVVNGTVTIRCIDEIHQSSEIRLATTQVDLDGATPGDPLDIGTTVSGGTAIPIWLRLAQGVHPAGDPYADLKLETVDLVEPTI